MSKSRRTLEKNLFLAGLLLRLLGWEIRQIYPEGIQIVHASESFELGTCMDIASPRAKCILFDIVQDQSPILCL